MLQMPGASHRTREHPVCLLIVDKSFVLRVPAQLAPKCHGNIAQMAHAGRTMANFDRRYRNAACPDAVEKISLVVVALIEVDFVRANH